jgi:hypothetical protein
MFAGYGVGLCEFEMLAGWEEADDYQGPLRDREVRTLALAEAYNVPKVKAFAMAIPGITLAPVEVLAKRFAVLCDHGVNIALECLTFMPGFTHTQMADVVNFADRPNATVQMGHHRRAAQARRERRRRADLGGNPVRETTESHAQRKRRAHCHIGARLPGEGPRGRSLE